MYCIVQTDDLKCFTSLNDTTNTDWLLLCILFEPGVVRSQSSVDTRFPRLTADALRKYSNDLVDSVKTFSRNVIGELKYGQ